MDQYIWTIMTIYMFGFVLCAPYYNWKFARKNNFVKWLFVGQLIAGLKAMIWPFSLVLFVVKKVKSSEYDDYVEIDCDDSN